MKKSSPTRIPMLVSALIIVLTVAYALIRYSTLPESIPIHFNARGEADGFGARGMIFLSPAIGLLFWGIMSAVSSSRSLVGHVNFPFTVPDEAKDRVVDLSRAMIAWMTAAVTVMLCIPSLALIHSSAAVTNISTAVCLAGMVGAAVYYLIKIRRVCREARPWDTAI